VSTVGQGTSDWEAVGSDDGLHSVHVAALNTTVEQMAIRRARANYGPRANLTSWRFSVRDRAGTGPVLHFRAGPNDAPIPFDS